MVFIFGFDGIIANTSFSIESALHRANLNFAEKQEHLSVPFDGSPDSTLKKAFFSQTEKMPEESFSTVKEFFLSWFYEHCLEQTVLLPGVADFLYSLSVKGSKILLVSAWPEKITQKIIKYFDIDGYFDSIFYNGKLEGIEKFLTDQQVTAVLKNSAEVQAIKTLCNRSLTIFPDFNAVKILVK